MALNNLKHHVIQKTCPECGCILEFQLFSEPLTSGNIGSTGRWSCVGKTCIHEEYSYESPEQIFEQYAKPLVETAYMMLDESVSDDDFQYNKFISSIYNGPPHQRTAAQQLPDYVRRRCPKCGTPLLFYQSHKNQAGVTGILSCPNGWSTSDDPADWCGYEEILTTPIEQLFREYFERAATKMAAADSIFKKVCPLCGSALCVRPVEENSRGWRTRWYCQTGLLYEDDDAVCGYEELSTEPLITYIRRVNKYFADLSE